MDSVMHLQQDKSLHFVRIHFVKDEINIQKKIKGYQYITLLHVLLGLCCGLKIFSSWSFESSCATSKPIYRLMPCEQITYSNYKVQKNIENANDLIHSPPQVYLMATHHHLFHHECTNMLRKKGRKTLGSHKKHNT